MLIYLFFPETSETALDSESETLLKEEYRSPSLNFSLLPSPRARHRVFDEPSPPVATSSRVTEEDLDPKVPIVPVKRNYEQESNLLQRLSKSQGPFSSPPRLSRTSLLQQ